MRAGIFTTTIEKIEDMGVQETRHFKLAFEPGTPFEYEAGQFVNIMIPETPDHKALKRPYSIASSPIWSGYIDLCWKRVKGGIATNYLWTLKQGDKLTIQGPLGRFVMKQPLPKGIIFVSTGTDIAPFRSMIHQLLKDKAPVQIWNIFGNRFVEDILYREEFEELARKNPNYKNVFTVSRPKPGEWSGETEYVQNMLKKHIPDSQDKVIYICGLTNMILEVQKTALEMGFAKEQIIFEKYD
jgi:ferredoxin-NADP reductase